MTSLPPTSPAEELPADVVDVGHYTTAEAGFDHGLVVLASGNAYWLVPGPVGYRLVVEPVEAEHIRRQLAKFDHESANWPPAAIRPPRRHVEAFTPALWALAAIAVFWAEVRWPRIVSLGQVDRAAVVNHGEWWRIATALFLHADVAHLVSNLLSGAFAFAAVTTTLGRVRGWGTILFAAIFGNALTVVAHPAEYRSLGASTAVFAAVGALCGHSIHLGRRGSAAQRKRAAMLPLISGMIVLALYGAGGAGVANVDVGAHVCGFISGVIFGWLGSTATPAAATDKEIQPN